jgi:hypothetical protein
MIYVLCGNYKQFIFFCQENNLNPRQEARYVSEESLLGVRDIEVVWTGTYYERPLEERLMIRKNLAIVGFTDVSEKYQTT